MTAAERNGRTYIAVTMRAADLGINCTDSTSLFNYAFDNFDTIDVDGTAMTVPKGVTVNDLTTDTAERNGKTLTDITIVDSLSAMWQKHSRQKLRPWKRQLKQQQNLQKQRRLKL